LARRFLTERTSDGVPDPKTGPILGSGGQKPGMTLLGSPNAESLFSRRLLDVALVVLCHNLLIMSRISGPPALKRGPV